MSLLFVQIFSGMKFKICLYIFSTLQMGQNPFTPEAVTEFLLFIKNNESLAIEKLDLTVM